jgi:hypothetical protein
MKKTRLLTGLLALSLVLATAPAVMAQDESAAPEASPDAAASAEPFDPANVPEFQQDEALAAYLIWEEEMVAADVAVEDATLMLEEELLAAGVAEEDIPAATAWLVDETANLSEKDVEELMAAKMLADREGDDDEFGKAEEDEPELFDGDEEEDGE